jgi:hypothetical protein
VREEHARRQYVGIDLHRRRSVIVRQTEHGELLETVRIDNDPVALALEIAKAGPDPEVVLEATYDWYWAAVHRGRITKQGSKLARWAAVPGKPAVDIERTHAWQNAFRRLARCHERRATVIDAFFDLADTIITVRSLIRRAWTTHRWDQRPNRRP